MFCLTFLGGKKQSENPVFFESLCFLLSILFLQERILSIFVFLS